MRAIFIDSYKQEVREVDIKQPSLDSLQQAVGGFIERAVCSGEFTDDLYVNEEALLLAPTVFFSFQPASQVLAGNGIIVGTNSEGDTVGAKTPLAYVKERVAFASVQRLREIMPWFKGTNEELTERVVEMIKRGGGK